MNPSQVEIVYQFARIFDLLKTHYLFCLRDDIRLCLNHYHDLSTHFQMSQHLHVHVQKCQIRNPCYVIMFDVILLLVDSILHIKHDFQKIEH